MKIVVSFGVVVFLNIASIQGKFEEERSSSYPDGPQGPDFAKSPGALKVDLLEGGIEKHWTIEEHSPGWVNNEVQAYIRDAVKQDESTKAITLTAQKSGSYVSSGRMNTNLKWNSGDSESTKMHGYLEVRAKFPAKTDYVTIVFPASFDFFLEKKLDRLHKVILELTFIVILIVDGNDCEVVI